MNKGFTLIETLFALMALSLCIALLFPMLQLIRKVPDPVIFHQDILAVYQLRLLLSQSRDVSVEPSAMSFHYRKEDWQLYYHHQNIVKGPGYEIFLMHVDDAGFRWEGGCAHLDYQKGEKRYDFVLYCE